MTGVGVEGLTVVAQAASKKEYVNSIALYVRFSAIYMDF